MKIHEYQAKDILVRYGVAVQDGRVCETPAEARRVAQEIGAPVVVKAQVHVGGRGKAGGIKLAGSPAEAEAVAAEILGMDIKGLAVRKVLVVRAVDLAAEFYLGITLDRAARRSAAMVSCAGGVDIEQVAAETPEKIAKLHVDPLLGLPDFAARRLLFQAGAPRDVAPKAAGFLTALYRAYVECDASLAEINPLVLTPEGSLVAVDAKIVVDDNSLYRHPDLAALAEEGEDDAIEAEAHRSGIQYVRLDGDIGVIGNGAGLVMATLDEVRRAGGRPANFLDIGGGARAEMVRECIHIVMMAPGIRGVLFNVFGGITRCDEVARGMLEATSTMKIEVPIVVRLTGTEAEAGCRLLAGSGLAACTTMQEAARMVVAAAYGKGGRA